MSNTDNTEISSCSAGTEGENLEEESQAIEPEDVCQTAKRGKPIHPIWSDAFHQPDVHCIQSPNNSICKRCKQSVRHHHKTLSVETHLCQCKPFKKIMMDKALRDRPRLVE